MRHGSSPQRSPIAGNMEVFARYGNEAQKKEWLQPLLDGKIRSSFAMTEKGIASSDATNIRTSIRKEGNDIVINGHKCALTALSNTLTPCRVDLRCR